MGWGCWELLSIAFQSKLSWNCLPFCMLDVAEAVYMLGLRALQKPICYLLPLLCDSVRCGTFVWMPRMAVLLDTQHMPCWNGVWAFKTPRFFKVRMPQGMLIGPSLLLNVRRIATSSARCWCCPHMLLA